MSFNWQREWPSLLLIVIPFIYLAIIWNTLPDTVPLHWNYKGEIDNWGSKNALIGLPFLLPGLVYILFLLAQFTTPKAKIERMGRKFHNLKFILVLFMASLCIFIFHASQTNSITSPTVVFVLIGLLFSILGNFFKTLQPNYFIGIRLPWTLKHESVWKTTHNIAGKLWFIGGLAMIIAVLALPSPASFITFSALVLLLLIVPIIYAWYQAKQIH